MKLLNFGSINIDYVYSVERFVRPGETLPAERLLVNRGGKGYNQSVALAKAGAEVYHAGKIGADGQKSVEELRRLGVDTRFVTVEPGIFTGHAIIQVARDGQNCILLYGGANQAITPAEADAVLAQFGPGDLLLLQNEISCLEHLLERAHDRGLRIALNPSPMSGALKKIKALRHVTWFLLNEIEGHEMTGQSDPAEICGAILGRFPDSRVVLTLGAAGALYRDREQTVRQGIFPIKVADTTSAGDAFTGFFLASVAAGKGAADALELAGKAAALTVGRPGAAQSIPTVKEIEEYRFPPVEG